jgi:hypothetical protein
VKVLHVLVSILAAIGGMLAAAMIAYALVDMYVILSTIHWNN